MPVHSLSSARSTSFSYRVVHSDSVDPGLAFISDERIALTGGYTKWIKQHLRIKPFVGNSANAVKTQIWSGICT